MRMRGLMLIAVAGLSLAGCGSKVVQRYDASPSATYAAFEEAWGRPVKTIQEIDGQSVPVVFDIEKQEGESLTATVSVDGKEAAMIGVEMAAAEGGKKTDVAGDIRIDSPLFWKAVGEKDGPQINGVMASMALQAMLRDGAKAMKETGSLGYGGPFASLGSKARANSTDPEEREAEVRRDAAAATRPMVSTEGADVSGTEVEPMVDTRSSSEN